MLFLLENLKTHISSSYVCPVPSSHRFYFCFLFLQRIVSFAVPTTALDFFCQAEMCSHPQLAPGIMLRASALELHLLCGHYLPRKNRIMPHVRVALPFPTVPNATHDILVVRSPTPPHHTHLTRLWT